jgi:hypothetical protein
MKFAAFALTAATLAAGSASATESMTDLQYIKANRCKGLATTLSTAVDPAAIEAFIKADRRTRMPYVQERAGNEFQRARREARSEDRRARLTAELTGPCQALMATGAATSKQ